MNGTFSLVTELIVAEATLARVREHLEQARQIKMMHLREAEKLAATCDVHLLAIDQELTRLDSANPSAKDTKTFPRVIRDPSGTSETNPTAPERYDAA